MEGKFIIYQTLLRVFGNKNENCIPGGSLKENGSGVFADINNAVLEELKSLSVTHIWTTGVIRHSSEGEPFVKGKAGSPFAISDYYDVNPYLATKPSSRMKEFEQLVARCKKSEIGVIIDFIPNHVSVGYSSEKDPFTDANYYPGRIHDGDWSDTVKLNFDVRDTWEKMLDILLFWAGKGVSGFRCDMVELVNLNFWHWCIEEVKKQYPDIIFIAEIYKKEKYRPFLTYGGFDYLYDKCGLYDTLRGITQSNEPAWGITSNWQFLRELQPNMLNFMENHDEQRLASDFFLGSPEKAMPAVFISLLFNTAPFMFYFGQEIGERGMDEEGYSGRDGRTTIFDFWSVASVRRWIKGIEEKNSHKYLTDREIQIYELYKQLFSAAMLIPAFRVGGNFDLCYANADNGSFDINRHFAFLRYGEGELYLCVVNFSDEEANLKITIPNHAFEFLEIPQTDKLNSSTPVDVSLGWSNCFILRLI